MKKNIAVIGANSVIAQALIANLAERNDVQHIYAFSRQPHLYSSKLVTAQCLSYLNEEDLKKAAHAVDSWDWVLVTTGILHSPSSYPEKSLQELSENSLEELFRINTAIPALAAKHFLPRLRKERSTVFSALSARIGSISDN